MFNTKFLPHSRSYTRNTRMVLKRENKNVNNLLVSQLNSLRLIDERFCQFFQETAFTICLYISQSFNLPEKSHGLYETLRLSVKEKINENNHRKMMEIKKNIYIYIITFHLVERRTSSCVNNNQ